MILLVLAGLALAGTLGTAQRARHAADKHRRCQILVEHLGTRVQALSALKLKTPGRDTREADLRITELVVRGLALYQDMQGTLRELGQIESGNEFRALHAEVENLYASGMEAFAAIQMGNKPEAERLAARRYSPVLVRLERRIAEAAEREDDEARRTQRAADIAFVVSLLVALSLIGMLAARFERLRRRATHADELRHQAFHDALTGLANRVLFHDRLEHALARTRRNRRPLAVLFLDLDDFKIVNDSLGHAVGDELLRQAATRVTSVLRRSDTAARLGGDEFAILLEDVDDGEAQAVARRIIDVFGTPYEVDGRELTVGVSIGIAVGTPQIDVQELLRKADVAMYAAKAAGKRAVRVYEPDMGRGAIDQLVLRADLAGAVERSEFELDFQPIISLDTGLVVGAEALVRWRHPLRGRLAPDEFIGLAEETGMISPLGEWVLRSACRSGARQHESMDICVNVSTRQLCDGRFPAVVAGALDASELDPARLVLELTESVLVADHDAIKEQLVALKDMGVRIAIDDFGTGYSVLSYLQEFPVDCLKIDKSFVEAMHERVDRANLVEGIINLATTLRLEIVAEGIEDPRQAALLRHMGCTRAQGFLFSQPLDDDALAAFATEQAAPAPATPLHAAPALAAPARAA